MQYIACYSYPVFYNYLLLGDYLHFEGYSATPDVSEDQADVDAAPPNANQEDAHLQPAPELYNSIPYWSNHETNLQQMLKERVTYMTIKIAYILPYYPHLAYQPLTHLKNIYLSTALHTQKPSYNPQ